MIKSIVILGRQAALGMAELESLYGPASVGWVGSHCAGLRLSAEDIPFARLGSATKLGAVHAEIDSSDWKKIEKALRAYVLSTSFDISTSGKFHLGISAIGFGVSPAKLSAAALSLKKAVRTRHAGSVRIVPNVEPELSTAQVFHNHLVDTNGAELLIVAHGSKTIIARTVAVQDIDSYTLRDRGRPKRDARVGMLPPKLAQTIINLATGEIKHHAADNPAKRVILDPFCGTGVVLQEALLMGYGIYGTDLEPRMVAYSQANIRWFTATFGTAPLSEKIEAGDATTHRWDFSSNSEAHASGSPAVACETYLGRPFTAPPSREILEQTVSEVNTIIKKFLQNIRPQLTVGCRLCLAVPAWDVQQRDVVAAFRHLPLLDALAGLGYRRISFSHVKTDDLVYHRQGQIVGRALVVLECAA